jgi:prolyl 4-hydroxylase
MKVKLREFYEIGQKVNDEPLIYVFEDFLDAKEVDGLLDAAKPKMQQALVSAANSGVESARRSGSNCWLPHSYNQVIEELSLRVAEVVGIGLEFAESLQAIYYAESEEYAPHFDAWDATTERGQRCMAKGGQRMVTCLLYLNDVEEGGGTCFPKLDMEIRAKRGRMVLFHNCHPGSLIRHPNSLHGGMPVIRGEKWACNFWFREQQLREVSPAQRQRREKSASPKFSRVI